MFGDRIDVRKLRHGSILLRLFGDHKEFLWSLCGVPSDSPSDNRDSGTDLASTELRGGCLDCQEPSVATATAV